MALTLAQGERELLMMQKKFKKKFRCENWENIAQGPFREEILENNIRDKEAWFENAFIYNRYFENKAEMDQQIDSELGEEYFSILERIFPDSEFKN